MELRLRLRPGRFILAIAVSVALVLSAPFIGFVRSWIRTTFPGQFVRIIGGAIACARRRGRSGCAAAHPDPPSPALRCDRCVAGMRGVVSLAEATGNPDVDVVQRFHFVEYGVITFLFYRAWRALGDPAILVLPVLAGLLVGIADEWLQWFIPNRVGEIADVLLNGVAIGCGLLFSLGADPPAGFLGRFRPGSLSRIGRLAAVTILAIAVFLHVVHLGYDIRDDESGSFKSRYSKATLQSLADVRREEWRVHPFPLVLQRVSREDQYMTEGVTHVQKRNELLAANDPQGRVDGEPDSREVLRACAGHSVVRVTHRASMVGRAASVGPVARGRSGSDVSQSGEPVSDFRLVSNVLLACLTRHRGRCLDGCPRDRSILPSRLIRLQARTSSVRRRARRCRTRHALTITNTAAQISMYTFSPSM